MSNFIVNPNGTINVSEGDISLFLHQDEDYILTEDGKVILKHGAVMNLANAFCIAVEPPEVLVTHNQSNYVIMRTAKKDKRVEYGIGESIPVNLDTEIAKKYPFITADTRAYDRAVLAFLGLAGKAYSDAEITVKKKTNTSSQQIPVASAANSTQHPVQSVPTNTAAQAEKPVSASSLNTDALEEKSENTTQTQQNVPRQAADEPKKETVATTEKPQNTQSLPAWWNEPDNYGDELNPDVFIVNKGPHKDENITVKSLFETEKSSVEWFASKALSKVEEFNKMIISCRRAIKAAM